ncbi:MAG TPA: hypothetical protein VG407_07055 [Caulobacteraceae bacterium]|nr:hypothetical protein [Caulobacteraceae bacterium]
MTRARYLAAIIDAINNAAWAPFGALLLPAGFFRLRGSVLGLTSTARRAFLAASPLGAICTQAARELSDATSAILVVGVETSSPAGSRYSGDQLMTAWGPRGLHAIARKVFPSNADTTGVGKRPYVVDASDAGSVSREVMLANRKLAALLVCYDAFAPTEARRGPTSKLSAIRYLHTRAGDTIRPALEDRWAVVERLDWRLRGVDLLLVGVHGFQRPGRDLYWQRHGIATASAALGGTPIAGAAHYVHGLPNPLGPAFLAAAAVPFRHLSLGLQRPARRLMPLDGLVVHDGGRGDPIAAVQLLAL